MTFQNVLFFCYVLPNPSFSAAGLRTLALINALSQHGYLVTLVSISVDDSTSLLLKSYGFNTLTISLNDANNHALLKSLNPHIVFFDRFVTHEQFAWLIKALHPDCLLILDTQDLHFVRHIRHKAVLQNKDPFSIQFDQIATQPQAHEKDLQKMILREIGCIKRSHLTLLVSDYETNLLQTVFQINPTSLLTLPFSYALQSAIVPFEARQGFIFIGNFRHKPNEDAILWLHRFWPKLREHLSVQTPIKIYGAFLPKKIQNLHDPAIGFYVKGYASDAFEVLSHAKVNLAPLRFGAGIKGKISDAWSVGTPSITTPIGAEGMSQGMPFGGLITESENDFINACKILLEDKITWLKYQQHGFDIINQYYHPIKNAQLLCNQIEHIQMHKNMPITLEDALLDFHGFQYNKYFSYWLQEKNARTLSKNHLKTGKESS
jgi:glycosyltransferase involved in cell wall biosynthesis